MTIFQRYPRSVSEVLQKAGYRMSENLFEKMMLCLLSMVIDGNSKAVEEPACQSAEQRRWFAGLRVAKLAACFKISGRETVPLWRASARWHCQGLCTASCTR